MNHTLHINHINVVCVKCIPPHGRANRGSGKPQKIHKPQKWQSCVFGGLCETQKHIVDPFFVYVNHKKHMNHKNDHHVFFMVYMN